MKIVGQRQEDEIMVLKETVLEEQVEVSTTREPEIKFSCMKNQKKT